MLRALVLAAALLALGCGDDTTTTIAASTDLAVPLIDLSTPGLVCGNLACTGTCSACLQLFGGVCAPPCMLANPSSCAAPATCRPLDGNPDGGSGATLLGSCSGFDGYCG